MDNKGYSILEGFVILQGSCAHVLSCLDVLHVPERAASSVFVCFLDSAHP